MGTAKLVTVVIPVYNREKRVRRAIESVQRQTFKDWELVVVDDCSTDQSFEVSGSYQDPRIRVLRTSRNSGAAAARNVAIQNSTSPFIALLDSDDMYHPDFLAISLEAIQATDVTYGFSYTGVGDVEAYSDRAPEPREVWTLPDRFQEFKKPYLYQLQVGTAAGIVVKRDVFQAIGLFDESLQAAEDTDWFVRASEFYKGQPIHKDLIFKDNDSKDRLTINYGKNARAYAVIIAKHQEDILGSSFLSKRWYYKSMWLNFYSGQRKAAILDYRKLKEKGLRDLKVRITYLAGLLLPTNLFIRLHKKLAKLR